MIIGRTPANYDDIKKGFNWPIYQLGPRDKQKAELGIIKHLLDFFFPVYYIKTLQQTKVTNSKSLNKADVLQFSNVVNFMMVFSLSLYPFISEVYSKQAQKCNHSSPNKVALLLSYCAIHKP